MDKTFVSEAHFDSRGEFTLDLARAEEKSRQHLGVWPEDYLAFLIQGAYALGARQIRLSSSWRSLIWEFDGQPLSALQLAALNPQANHLPGDLQPLRMALYLLGQSRYPGGRWTSDSMALVWRGRKFQVRSVKSTATSVHRLELYLPASRMSLGWMLTRNAILSTLPEYAAIRKRLRASPMQLRMPWPEESPALIPQPFPLAVGLQGSLQRSDNPPLPSLHVIERTWDLEESCWFVASDRSTLQCLIQGLAYPGPPWGVGACWLYSNRLKTDLGQRSLNQNEEFDALLQKVRARLAEVLLEVFQDPGILQSCRPWILSKITQRLQEGLPLGFLAQIPLIESVPRGPLRFAELHAIYQEHGQRLYFFADQAPREPPPSEVPPIVILTPENASILRSHFATLLPAEPLCQEYRQRHSQREAWLNRPVEPLEIAEVEFSTDLDDAQWRGQLSIQEEIASPIFQLFSQQRLVAQFTLPEPFPVGFCCRAEPLELAMNSTWTRPAGHQWDPFQRSLLTQVGRWLLRIAPGGPEWILDRTYELAPDSFFEAPLIAVGQQRFSLNQARQWLDEDRLEQWILQGWSCPRDFRRVLEALGQGSQVDRLERYRQDYLKWQAQPVVAATLAGPAQDWIGKLQLPGQKGELAFARQEMTEAQLTSYREGRLIAVQGLDKGLPRGLCVAYDHPYFLPNPDWSGVKTQGLAWQDLLQAVLEQGTALLLALLKSKEAQRNLLVLRLLAWLPKNRWPAPRVLADTCWFTRLDGSPIATTDALAQLESGPPVQVVIRPESLKCRPGLEKLWVVTPAELNLLASLWGPNRVQNYHDELLTPKQNHVDLTHLPNSSLKPAKTSHGLPLPDIPYVAAFDSSELRWGLQAEVGEVSRIRVFVKMQPVEVLSMNWLYQVQASLNLESVDFLPLILDKLCQQIETAILQQTPQGYRALLALASWQRPQPWYKLLQAEGSLGDVRGARHSPQQWVTYWNPKSPAPYLLESDLSDPQMLQLLPDGPVVLLSPAQAQAAETHLPSVVHYRKGLLKAWHWVHQPLYAGPDPATVSYSSENDGTTILAEIAWTQQTIVFLWRGREIYRLSRPNWPGYELQVDCSQDLLEQTRPEWRDWTPKLAPYFFYLAQFFKNPDLLEESRSFWESLPVEPAAGPPTLYVTPGEADVRNLLAQQKLLWKHRQTRELSKLREMAERWLKFPVEIEVTQTTDEWPARLEKSLHLSVLTLNQAHPWFREQSLEICALRLNLWLQSCGQIGWREAAGQRVALLQEFSFLDRPEIA